MVMLAFVEKETGWIPCQVAAVKKGDTFYLVRDGKKETSSFMIAMADAKQSNPQDENSWVIDARPME